jgi:hypothetical protein
VTRESVLRLRNPATAEVTSEWYALAGFDRESTTRHFLVVAFSDLTDASWRFSLEVQLAFHESVQSKGSG